MNVSFKILSLLIIPSFTIKASFEKSSLIALEQECNAKGGRIYEKKCFCLKTYQPLDMFPIEELKQNETCPKLFGFELTFTNDLLKSENDKKQKEFSGVGAVTETEHSLDLIQRWQEEIQKKCILKNDCSIIVPGNHLAHSFKVQYSDGFYYIVGPDAAVIEINMRPVSQLEVASNYQRIKKDIFEMAKFLGIVPHPYRGGGHIHLDIASHFKGDAKLFLKFLIDFQNHPYLALCALGENYITNPPLAILDKSQRQSFDYFSNFAMKHFQEGSHKFSINQIVAKLNDIVFFNTLGAVAPDSKFQALSLFHAHQASEDEERDFETIEVRSIRPQTSPDQMLLLMKLFEARIDYLSKTNDDKVKYRKKEIDIGTYEKAEVFFKRREMDKILSIEEHQVACYNEFKEYVTESGLDWSKYIGFLRQNTLLNKTTYGLKLLNSDPDCY